MPMPDIDIIAHYSSAIIRLVNFYWFLSFNQSHHAHPQQMLVILLIFIDFWLIFRMPRKNRNVAMVAMNREN